jgi:hypothetical protein
MGITTKIEEADIVSILFDIAGPGQERALLAVALLIELAVRKRSLLRYLKSTKSVSRLLELPLGLADILVEC